VLARGRLRGKWEAGNWPIVPGASRDESEYSHMRLGIFIWLRFLIPLAISALLSSCLIVPSQLPDPRPFNDNRISFIQIGDSSKQEIAAAMSDFSVRNDSEEVSLSLFPKQFRNGRTWLYAQRREELAVMLAAAGTFTTNVSEFGDHDYHFLQIDFDDDGIVKAAQVLRSEGGCSRDGVCVRELAPQELEYWLLASAEEDRLVKQRQLSSQACDVFLYGRTTTGTIRIELDSQVIGEIMDRRHYFFASTSSGDHQLSLTRPSLAPGQAFGPFGRIVTQHDFECLGGQRLFFELRPRRGEIMVSEVDESDGWIALDRRRLTLIED
jgi:hypothetical protein